MGRSSESDAIDGLKIPFYRSRHAKEPHLLGNQFDPENRGLIGYDMIDRPFREDETAYMDFSSQGKHAMVLGGGRGIGKSIARESAREGVDVVIAARTLPEL